MNRKMQFKPLLAIAVFLSLLTHGLAQGTGKEKLEGAWAGSLQFQGVSLRLVLNLSLQPDGSLKATLDSPDQGAKGIPAGNVTFENDTLQVMVPSIGGRYTAKVDPEPTLLEGLWQQGGLSLPLQLSRSKDSFQPDRPQHPVPPFPYTEEEIAFVNADAGLTLSGTLTLPEGGAPFPGVVLVSGSGTQNRDEEIAGHKPFAVIADHLTRAGFAVLRYDDRGAGLSQGDPTNATTRDFATDANAAFDFLKNHSAIDTTAIFIAGHSEGALIAAMIASVRPDVAGICMMAGPGVTGEKVLQYQSEMVNRAMGRSENSIRIIQKMHAEIYSILKKNSDDEKAKAKIRQAINSSEKKLENDPTYQKLSGTDLQVQLDILVSPWFRNFLTTNPEDYLSKVACPVLAINGSLDLQVDARENLTAIEKALIFGGNSEYKTEELPGLNHLFQTAVTGSPAEYGTLRETIAPQVLALITEWLLKVNSSR